MLQVQRVPQALPQRSPGGTGLPCGSTSTCPLLSVPAALVLPHSSGDPSQSCPRSPALHSPAGRLHCICCEKMP